MNPERIAREAISYYKMAAEKYKYCGDEELPIATAVCAISCNTGLSPCCISLMEERELSLYVCPECKKEYSRCITDNTVSWIPQQEDKNVRNAWSISSQTV